MQRELVERRWRAITTRSVSRCAYWIGRLYVIARLIVRDDGGAEDATQGPRIRVVQPRRAP